MAPTTRVDRSELISLGEVTPNNVGQLRKLNAVIFPVAYSDKFYAGVLETPALARLGPSQWRVGCVRALAGADGDGRRHTGYFNDCAVAAVCVRKEPQPDKTVHLYIMTLGVLAPYRHLGVGAALLAYVHELAAQTPLVTSVYLHVQAGNDEALRFYTRHGFAVAETVPDYYKNVTPTEAMVLRKPLGAAVAKA
jgi:N-alpha-acetyltransferase 50